MIKYTGSLFSTLKDSNGDTAYYIPSKNDNIGNTVVVGEN
ncbi:hypothetical protein J2Z42_002435 [Clostridium algifaecis]|uniref:Uncharacterized protein n=1 Tax=Clostridium algifaecis TaxID=1472040 RepID=A0ABS4KUK6_9CLOT|nr:hypothetical protein [Clostridium algifaecis]